MSPLAKGYIRRNEKNKSDENRSSVKRQKANKREENQHRYFRLNEASRKRVGQA